MEGLERLELQENELVELPSEIEYLKNLRMFKASDNNLIQIPENMHKMTSLEILDVANNEISKMFKGVDNLKFLKKLNLTDNLVKPGDIPKELYLRKKLKQIEVSSKSDWEYGENQTKKAKSHM